MAKRFKGLQVKGWRAPSIKRHKNWKGKKPGEKYLFTAELSKGKGKNKKTVFWSDVSKNTSDFKSGIRNNAHRFEKQ